MSRESTVLVGVGVYLLLMLVIGIRAARHTDTALEFIVAGRKLSLGMCTASLMATWIGGGTILGAAGAARDGGYLATIADPFGAALCLVLVGFFFVRLFRRLKLLTVVQFFENRYGRLPSLVAACALATSSIAWVGGLTVAFGVTLQTLTGFPLEYGILAGGAIVLVYTTAGGMWAVAVTDYVQVIIVAIGLTVLFVLVSWQLGDWGAVAGSLPEGSFRLWPAGRDLPAWLDYLRAWLIIGLADAGSQSLLQRGFSARSERTAQYAFYLAGAGYLLLGLIPITLGVVSTLLLPDLDDAESVIPMLAMEYLHPLALAVFVGALLAAIMSSADSALLSAASLICTNILPLLGVSLPARRRLHALRITIPLVGVVGVTVALKVQTVYALILDANTLLLSAVTVPFVLGVWWRRANRAGALAGMASGCATLSIAGLVAPGLPADLLGMAACLLAMLLVVPLTQTSSPPAALRSVDGEATELRDRLGILPPWSGHTKQRDQ